MENLLIATVLCMALDVATGVAGAVKAGALKSGKMREGLWHKAGFFGLIALAYLLEFAASVADLGISVPAVRRGVRVRHPDRSREHRREPVRAQPRHQGQPRR